MASSQDTEITLGTAKLLGIFFGLVMSCAVFFARGYTLGRKSESGLSSSATPGSVSAAGSAKPASSATGSSSAPMTFYKAVEQQNPNPQMTPPDAAGAPATDASAGKSTASSSTTSPEATQAANLPDPMAPIPGTGYFVQVAAVSKDHVRRGA